jgi:oligoribonuclease
MADYLFLDLETTGLDQKRCRIIEVACVLTRDDFVPYAEFERVVWQPMITPSSRCWEDVAFSMHKASGLYDLAANSDLDLTDCGRELLTFLGEHLGERKANLAGNSVHFDRSFLTEYAPDIFPFLTHRQLDVSSLRLLGESLGLPKFDGGKKPHRAMADVRHSLRELAHWIKALRAE